MNEIKLGFFGSKKKTCVALRFLKEEFTDGYIPTIEDDFSKVIDVDNQSISLSIIDTCGQDDFNEMRFQYYAKVDGMILFIDTSNLGQISDIKQILIDASDASEHPLFYAIGCIKPINSEDKDEILPKKQIKAIGNLFRCPIFELDVRTGENVNEIVHTIVKKIINNENNEEFDFTSIDVENIAYYDEIDEVDASEVREGEWNIGLIEHKNANAAEFGNKIIYGEHWNDSIEKVENDRKLKIVEVENVVAPVELLFRFNFKNAASLYKSVKGLIFVLSIDADDNEGNEELLKKIAFQLKRARKVNSDLFFVIAADSLEKFDKGDASLYSIYENLEKTFGIKVFEVSSVTGENIEEMFLYILKKIAINNKMIHRYEKQQRRKNEKNRKNINNEKK